MNDADYNKIEPTESAPHRLPDRVSVLIVTAVEAEREAVLRGLANAGSTANPRFEVIAAGVGPAYAAASTAAALARAEYDLVMSAGIGGGFPGIAPIGSLVLADAIVAADLGAETAEGQLTLDELGFGTSRAPVSDEWTDRMARALETAGLVFARGPILTVSLATGRGETARLRERLVPGAAAEGMEGYGVAIAATQFGVACAELRAISNVVGPRDRSAWRIGDALKALEEASRAIAGAWSGKADPAESDHH
ncbi:futalosine hydrolase [Paenibacillus sp. LHD-117]|uniref:futalosine hydrolase n=1 Tax=Paenibacillus sp. LHD-117 TaxID=3071412 RepID=UPI0027E0E106|nr:futalosine hydrolase [Paenibacillus sp. LHD-117]MDQ6418756.1 futalosine hydrolase [Paenibacillus sp. LHD-117]